MNVLDLFSGIGGFSLGLERAGMKTIAFCEIEPYCRRVLAHHWPDVHQFNDVKDITSARWSAARLPRLDAICGGFPCQGLSLAGLGLGLADVRSALWWEFARIIGEFQPRWVIIENVPALRSRGLDQVLGSLAAIGYDAEWNCIPAAAFGAPHRRDRIWITAYPAVAEGQRCGEGGQGRLTDRLAWIRDCPRWHPADTDYAGLEEWESERGDALAELTPAQRSACAFFGDDPNAVRWAKSIGGPEGIRRGSGGESVGEGCWHNPWGNEWTDEPALCGVDDGLQAGVDLGLYALGNSIVPQIAEAHGRAIIEWELANAC